MKQNAMDRGQLKQRSAYWVLVKPHPYMFFTLQLNSILES